MASSSYFFPIFPIYYFFLKILLFFQKLAIFSYFCSKIPNFSFMWNKTYRFLQVCSYMLIHAPEEKTHCKSFKPLLYLVLCYSVLFTAVFLRVGLFGLRGGCSCTVVEISTGLRALNKGYIWPLDFLAEDPTVSQNFQIGGEAHARCTAHQTKPDFLNELIVISCRCHSYV